VASLVHRARHRPGRGAAHDWVQRQGEADTDIENKIVWLEYGERDGEQITVTERLTWAPACPTRSQLTKGKEIHEQPVYSQWFGAAGAESVVDNFDGLGLLA